MLIAHLADLHLGYRAYQRLGQGGANQRERDVSEAVARVVTQVIEAAPDIVVVAGDVFHSVRPSNATITDGFRHFTRLRQSLPRTPVVMIAGNHDAPRPAERGSILRLLAEIPGVHVADDAARVIRLDDMGASISCLPHAALADAGVPSLEPDPGAAVNVLLLHATVTGPGTDERIVRLGEYGGIQVPRAALAEEAWDYVALGHHHAATSLAPHVWYAGAPERTTPRIWAEASLPKGWVLFDTASGSAEFREVPTREVVELPGFSARAADSEGWLSAEEVDDGIRAAVEAVDGGVADRIARLVITDIPRDLFRRLDHRQIRALKAEALHFQLEARRPESRREPSSSDGRRRTLEEEVEQFLTEWEPTTTGIDGTRLLDLAAEYLDGAAAGRRPDGREGTE